MGMPKYSEPAECIKEPGIECIPNSEPKCNDCSNNSEVPESEIE